MRAFWSARFHLRAFWTARVLARINMIRHCAH
jgi:hypothetical protein